MITREQFIKAVGCEPQDDDLERCNCPLAGEPIFHSMCGWDDELNLPRFIAAGVRDGWARDGVAS